MNGGQLSLRSARDRQYVAADIVMAAWFALAVMLAVALATIHIGRASLWTDEIFARYYYDVFGLRFLLGEGLAYEPTPPTYPILLKGWMLLFGDSEGAVRSLSAAASVAALPFVYWLGKELSGRSTERSFGRTEALIAATLYAASPMGVYFAQEARVYALSILPACILLWAVAVLLRAPRSRLAAAAYALSGVACLYLHATMIFLVAACGLAGVGWLLMQADPVRWHELRLWLALNAAVVLLSLPYTVHLLMALHVGGLDWIPPLRPRTVAAALTVLVTGMLTERPWPGLLVALLVLGSLAASVILRRPPPRMMVVCVVIPALFLGMLTIVSLKQPVLLPRVLCWVIVPVAVLTGRQILVAGRSGVVVGLATALAVVIGLTAQETTRYGGKEPWREAFAALAPLYRPGDLVVLSPRFDPLIPVYYAGHLQHVRVLDDALPATIMTRVAERLGVAPIGLAELDGDLGSGRTVWLLSNGVDLPYVTALKGKFAAGYDAIWPCGQHDCIEVAGWRGAVSAAGSGPGSTSGSILAPPAPR